MHVCTQPSRVALVVKNSPANAGVIRDMSSIPGSGKSSGGGNGNPLWYSCLENPVDRGAWQATVHEVTKTQTPLKHFSTHICTCVHSVSLENTDTIRSYA